MTDTKDFLRDIMSRYTTDHLENPEEFERRIRQMCELNDWKMEGYKEDEVEAQRDLSIQFHWGHNHDFGTFQMDGRMGDRHIEVIATFIDELGLPKDLTGKKVLDVGVWCGGTTLLLAGMGAEVEGLEEVSKYAEAAEYLCRQFGFKGRHNGGRTIFNFSLYDFQAYDSYDYIIFPGVLYHLSDMIVGLRILFNALKDGGMIFVESAAIDVNHEYGEPMQGSDFIEYQKGKGNNWFIPDPQAIENMLQDVGFEKSETKFPQYQPRIRNNRCFLRSKRTEWRPMLKAGLSRKVK